MPLSEAMAKAYGKPKVMAQKEIAFEVKEGAGQKFCKSAARRVCRANQEKGAEIDSIFPLAGKDFRAIKLMKNSCR